MKLDTTKNDAKRQQNVKWRKKNDAERRQKDTERQQKVSQKTYNCRLRPTNICKKYIECMLINIIY